MKAEQDGSSRAQTARVVFLYWHNIISASRDQQLLLCNVNMISSESGGMALPQSPAGAAHPVLALPSCPRRSWAPVCWYCKMLILHLLNLHLLM